MAWPKNIILVGFMASGKSHVGRILAQRTGRPLADSDELIVARAGKSVERIFAEDGEAAFRTLERAVISELCAGSGRIISAGGGAFVDPDNRRTMRAGGRVFCLHARPETIYKRLAATNPGSDNPEPDNPSRITRIRITRSRLMITPAPRRCVRCWPGITRWNVFGSCWRNGPQPTIKPTTA